MTASRVALLACLMLAGAACDSRSDGGTYEITQTRPLTEPRREHSLNASSIDRFTRPASPDSEANTIPQFAWDLPEGWTELAPTNLRVANFAVDGRDDLECYVSTMPGRAGGLAANVNRWRGQMALPPISEQEVAELPHRTLFGSEATYVELDGTFTPMRGGSSLPGFKMLGVVLQVPRAAIFVKMIGPASAVQAQLANFESLCASLRLATSHGAGPPGPDDGSEPQPGAFDPARVQWDAPQEWVRGERSGSYRLVTYSPSAAPDVECYVSVLAGRAGGLAANLNRWRDQMGQAPLTPGQIDDLPRLEVLDRESPMVDIEGEFSGMGGASRKAARMLGVVCEFRTHTVFVKMIGPADQVAAERERFEAFCGSLRMREE